jgi:hypothetical protein
VQVDLVAAAAPVLLWVAVVAVILVAPAAIQTLVHRLMPQVVVARGSLLMLPQLPPAMDNTKDPELLVVQA